MTINPNTLVSKSFIGKELSQGHQAGRSPCVGNADPYLLVPHQSQVSVELSMLHGTTGGDGTPEDNQLVTYKHLGIWSEQTVTSRMHTKPNGTLGQSF